MPIYEYVCQNCGEDVEKLQRLSDAPLTDCPACGQATLKRKISAAGFRLAGGGWYETDFKSDKRRNLSGGDDKSAKSGSDGGKTNTSSSSSSNGSSAGDGAASKSGGASGGQSAGKSGGDT